MTRAAGRWFRSAGSFIALAAVPVPALADAAAERVSSASVAAATTPFAADGQWVFGLENLIAVTYTPIRQSGSVNFPDAEMRNRTRIDSVRTTVNAPTLTIDRFVLPRFSVGMGLGYTADAQDQVLDSSMIREGTVEQDANTTSEHSGYMLTATPRIGYALPIMDDLSVWGRLGVTGSFARYESAGTSAVGFDGGVDESTYRSATSRHALGATASVLLTYSPLPYLTFVGGPGIHKGIVAYHRQTSGSDTEIDSNPPSVTGAVGLALRL